MTWKNPRPGDLSAEGLRETLTSLEAHLAALETSLGAAGGSYDTATGTTSEATPVTLGLAWTSWSPTPGGITLGNGTVDGGYAVFGKTCLFRHRLTWGSTPTSLAGGQTLALPFTSVGAGTAVCHFADTSLTGRWTGSLIWGSGSATGTYSASGATVTSTVPFTWASTDTCTVMGIMEIA